MTGNSICPHEPPFGGDTDEVTCCQLHRVPGPRPYSGLRLYQMLEKNMVEAIGKKPSAEWIKERYTLPGYQHGEVMPEFYWRFANQLWNFHHLPLMLWEHNV
ncbi:hypothetical protein CBL_09835 [Carabus blaptoides fortunei]